MRAQSAAPGGSQGTAGSTSTGKADDAAALAPVQAQPLPAGKLAATVIERLHRSGIDTCEQWLALKRRRFEIFGVTRKLAQLVDQAVADMLQT